MAWAYGAIHRHCAGRAPVLQQHISRIAAATSCYSRAASRAWGGHVAVLEAILMHQQWLEAQQGSCMALEQQTPAAAAAVCRHTLRWHPDTFAVSSPHVVLFVLSAVVPLAAAAAAGRSSSAQSSM